MIIFSIYETLSHTDFPFNSAAQKKSSSQEHIPRNSYANNFGHSVGGEGYRGVEGVLVANLVTPLVTRCVESATDLYGSDNIVSVNIFFISSVTTF